MGHIGSGHSEPGKSPVFAIFGNEIPLAAAGGGAYLVALLAAMVSVIALSLAVATALALAIYLGCGVELVRMAQRRAGIHLARRLG